MFKRRSIYLIIILILSSSPVLSQISGDNFELQQELNTIKQELSKGQRVNADSNNSNYLLQKISELSKELQAAQNKIKKLEQELKSPNKEQEKGLHLTRNFFPNNIKSTELLENTNNNEYKKQLEISNNTIIEQTKQLSKAYSEIEKLKRNLITTDKLIDNMILQAERLRLQGKTQEAIAIYEALDRLDIKKPKIYQNLALIYQGLGMNSEAKKQYNKLDLLFPNLKTNTK